MQNALINSLSSVVSSIVKDAIQHGDAMNRGQDCVYEQESAFDLFVNQNAAWLRLRCGCMDVDDILQGGILKGELTELVGSIAVGKTQVNCLLFIVLFGCFVHLTI